VSKDRKRADHYAILRNRDFLFYLIGRFVASFGSQMLTVAVGWELYERTHSPLNLGLVGLTQFIPMVLMTLPAGHVADTRERKKVILTMQAVLGFASLGLATISILQLEVIWVYCCLFAAGIARTFLWSASASFMPQLVSREQFPLGVTWSASSFQFSAVTGPAAGGALIALAHKYDFGFPPHSAAFIYLLNALAAIICFTLIYLIRVHHKPLPKERFTLEGLLGGFNFVFKTPIILATITLDLFAVLFGGATALLPVFAKDILHVGPTGLGLLEAALPVGSLLCALYYAHKPPLEKAGRALLIAVIIFGAATIGFGLSKWFWLSMLMLFICGFADNISVIVRHTLVQVLTPDAMRGRVSAVNNLFIGTSNELGGFESGAVSHVVNKYFAPRHGMNIGPIAAVVSGGIMTIVTVVLVAKVWPELPRFGRLVPKEEKAVEATPPV
jgi:MFS family permease